MKDTIQPHMCLAFKFTQMLTLHLGYALSYILIIPDCLYENWKAFLKINPDTFLPDPWLCSLCVVQMKFIVNTYKIKKRLWKTEADQHLKKPGAPGGFCGGQKNGKLKHFRTIISFPTAIKFSFKIQTLVIKPPKTCNIV